MRHFFSVIQTPSGTAVSGASIDVYNAGGTVHATIYSDDGVTPVLNPLVSASDGTFGFYVADGRYDLKVSGVNLTTRTFSDVEIFDATEKNAGDGTLTATAANFTTLTVTGNETVGGTLQVTGTTTLNSGTLNGTFAGDHTLSGNISIGGTLGVVGASSFKTSPWYDVTSYGAKGDGVTDDTAAFQAALNAANTAHGGKVFVPMGTNAYVIAGQLVMDGFVDVSLVGASEGSPAGATPRSWLKFTGTTSPLISYKSVFGCTIKGLYLQYTNGAFVGTFIEMGHGASALDSSGNRITDNFIGKQLAGGTAAVLLSLDQAIDNIVENNQFNDAAVAIRGRNAPSGSGTDYSVKNTIKDNAFGVAGAATITTAFIQNIGESTALINNDFEIGTAAVATLAYTGAMQAGGVISGGFIGDMSGTSTFTILTIPTNSAWQVEGVTFGTVSTNVTGVVMQNNASLVFSGNKLSSGTTIGTMFSVGTGDSLVVCGNKWQGAISSFLTGTPASGVVEDNTSHVRIPTGSVTVPGISFLQNNAIGWTIGSSNHMQLGFNGAGPMMSNLQLGIGSGMALISTPSVDPETNGADVSLSRLAVGMWGVGTGAAGNKAGLIQSGNTTRLIADLSLAANTSLQTIFSYALPAFANNYNFHVSLMYSQATLAVASAFGVQCAVTAPTNLVANAIVYTAAAVSGSGTSGNITTTTATNIVTFTPSATGTVFNAIIEGQIEVGASGGTLNIMASQSNAGDLLTIKRGSYCQLF